MNLLKKLDLFKITIVALFSIFLYLFSQYSKNGRYEPCEAGFVIDTRTGNVFSIDYDGYSDPPFEKPQIPKNIK